ncbi:MAG: tRNA uridine-5-carboxymethylaminomethyl(34) synthesis GTPase MnmE, partial [Nitrospirae bacterium]
MYNLDDTIAAISTPPGEGGIGIVRVSGGDSINVVGRLFRAKSGKDISEFPSHSIHYGWIIDPSDGAPVDEVLLTVMRAPRTYTREDVVEINCHGGMLPLRKILSLLLGCGVRLAGPGEFTFRAFMNGRIDLAQAEAVMDLIRAKTERSGKIAAIQLRGGLSDRVTTVRDGVLEVLAIIEAYIDFP